MAVPVAIVSVGYSNYTSVRKETRERSEVSFAAVRAALDRLGMTLADIDATVYSSVDGFEGSNRGERLQPCFGQEHGLPVFSVNTGGTGGASAIKEAYHLIGAGLYDTILVFAGSTFNAVVDNQQVLNTAMDPIMEKPLGPGAISIGALYGSRYLHDHGWGEEELAAMAAQSHGNAASNPYAHLRQGWTYDDVMASRMISWPLREYEICPISSGAACMIMASEERAREFVDQPIWLDAIGASTDTFISGYREYAEFDQLEQLSHRIYAEAGITDPLDQLDVAEIFNPFSIFELLAYESLGFCDKGKAPELVRQGVTAMNGKLPVNPSGGVVATNSGIAASLTRFAEIALQLWGEAEGRQVAGPPRLGLAHAWGGSDGQFHCLGILRRD